jgi:fructan beta-fructosidase
MRFFFLALIALVFTNCKKENTTSSPKSAQQEDIQKEKYADRFRESYRPQYHFTPPEKWMNDPNGLLFHKGTYHLFYQYYPDDIVWGPMHWGHATSTDLMQWEHKPIALYPDALGLIFSGSAVMDTDNTSGLGSLENPPMVAIFTYHLMEGEKAGRNDFQTQGIAYSLDEGDTWTKYDGNPVIGNTGIKDFRDPKVMWHDASRQWILTLVAGDHAKFYSSPNLTDWTHLSDFGKDKGAHGGVWECPDIFPLSVEGTDETKWVLLISINPGAPNGGSGTQYFVGEFDGTYFTTDQEEHKWLDYGTDNYAGVTFNGLPDTERTFIGWMSNWNYARDTPTENWRSAMTLPRKLTLKKNEQGYYLNNFPVTTIDNYTDAITEGIDINGSTLSLDAFNQHRIDITTEGTLESFNVTFKNSLNERLLLGYDATKSQFYIDRRISGKVDFEPRFAERLHIAPAILDSDFNTTITLFIDASSIELFVNDGSTVLTDQIFPTTPYTEMTLDGGLEADIKVSNVRRIWN